MGGGSDSRIPSILNDCLCENVVVRTYDFDPETAAAQIASWVEELNPALIIGESLGALHALRVKGIPRILISPALNASFYFRLMAWLSFIPGITRLFDRIYRPREGDRQALHFTHRTLSKYPTHRRLALTDMTGSDIHDSIHAFFGSRDHYRRSGIVSIRTWKKHFGNTFTIYEGSHFMEEEHIHGVLVNRISEILKHI